MRRENVFGGEYSGGNIAKGKLIVVSEGSAKKYSVLFVQWGLLNKVIIFFSQVPQKNTSST